MQVNHTAARLIPVLLVAGITLMTWQYGGYMGDDKNALAPVARHSLILALQYFLRPFEYGIVQTANLTNLQLWPWASLLMAVSASTLQVKTIEAILQKEFTPAIRIAATAASPLWFQLISQVDTVSQSLCNLTFSAAIYVLLTQVLPDGKTRVTPWAALVNLLCCVLLFSKELAVAAALLTPLVTAIIVYQKRALDRLYIASVLLVAATTPLWLYLKLSFNSLMPGATGHYNTALSASKLGTNLISLAGFPLTPVPTSFLSFATLKPIWMAASLLMISLFFWSVWRLAKQGHNKSNLWLLAILLIGGCAPLIYIHSSELYVSMIGGYLTTLVIGVGLSNVALKLAYASALLACSYINAWIYYKAEFLPKWAADQRIEYSLYNGPDGRFYRGKLTTPICPILGTDSVSWMDGRVQCDRAHQR
ncbi:hypothetical protein JY96_03355 [Aquabacterium sp. NJ1]|nr:hypothetical protein JY96_03355 [Aquabacterium sp. NJ1]